MYIGFHSSISPSILDGLKYANTLGASSVQIFLGSNQSSSLKSKQKLLDTDILSIRNYINDKDMYVSIHAIYLLNFCSFPPESKRIKYAQDNLIYDLETGESLGAKCVVLHIGSKKDLDEQEAYNNMAHNVLYVLSKIKSTTKHIRLLLETPAGQGTQIATTIENMAKLYNIILTNCNNSKYKLTKSFITKRLGFCIDTAHIFSSGYAIRMSEGMNRYFNKFHKLIGLDKVGLIHLNDSKADLNSRRDIHEGIGDGYIFGIHKIKQSTSPIPIKQNDYLQNLITLLKYSKQYKIPIVLETHKAGSPATINSGLYSQELGLLKSLYENPKWIKDNLNWRLKHFYKTTSRNNISKNKKSIHTNKQYKLIDYKTNKTHKLYPRREKLNKSESYIQYPVNIIIINKLKIIREYYQKIERDTIRTLAYGKAILALRNFPEEIVNGNQLLGVKGIGPKIIKKVDEYINTGDMLIFKECNIMSKLNEYNKKEKMKVSSILGFGEKKAQNLARIGVRTYDDLLLAVKQGKLDLNSKESMGVKYHKDLIKMIPRTEAGSIFNNINKVLKHSGIVKEYNLEIELAGSYPSGKQESKDIDILIFTDTIKNKQELEKKGGNILEKVKNILMSNNILIEVVSIGHGMLMCLIKSSVLGIVRHLDLRLLPKFSEIFGRLYFTSGRDFNQVLRQRAKSMGYKLNEFDLLDIKTGKSVFSNMERKKLKEKDIFDKLDYNYIPISRRR